MSFLKYLIPASFLALLPTLSFAGSHGGNLDPSDAVGISFWIISIAMVAATVFFLMESLRVKGKWRTSLVVGALVTLVGMAGWIFILYEIFAGEASKVSADSAPESVQSAFNTMKWIVTIGWAIYPIGYFMGYMAGGADANSLNFIYNIADVINKIAFCLAIWAAATTESDA